MCRVLLDFLHVCNDPVRIVCTVIGIIQHDKVHAAMERVVLCFSGSGKRHVLLKIDIAGEAFLTIDNNIGDGFF